MVRQMSRLAGSAVERDEVRRQGAALLRSATTVEVEPGRNYAGALLLLDPAVELASEMEQPDPEFYQQLLKLQQTFRAQLEASPKKPPGSAKNQFLF
jgi:hypothetical protein